MILFLLGMLIALLCAAVVFGPGPDRFRRFLVNLEKEYAHGRQIRWREVRPVLRSATSADEKLTALGRLIGNVSIDPDLYSKFELADEQLGKLEKYLGRRYFVMLCCAIWVVLLLIPELVLSGSLALQLGFITLSKQALMVSLFILPFLYLVVILLRIGSLEKRVNSLNKQLEEAL